MSDCGKELSASAVVPDALAELFAHVSENLDAHAQWVGSATPAADREQQAMRSVAQHYRAIASAARATAATLRSLATLDPAPHDPSTWDRDSFRRWMTRKIELQRAFATQLLEHAEASERVLEEE